MGYLLLVLIFIALFLALSFFRVSLIRGSILFIGAILVWFSLAAPGFWPFFLLLAGALALATLLNHPPYRQRFLSGEIFARAGTIMPRISATEEEALGAGTVWWDQQIWSGSPAWEELLAPPPIQLSPEEQAFLDGPTEELCQRINDWEICHQRQDLPPELWTFLREHNFFGMIIPRQYGGLQFSATAHSAIISKIASRSVAVAVTVMVPNSIGPAELLFHHGSQRQKEYYLPRLASGEEIPCFGLTGPTAGSDASATPDSGVLCYDDYQGEQTLGIRLNWDKRYITLGPIATLFGLAFQLYDPDAILGSRRELGITFALVPRDTPGIRTGHRHLPLNCPFQNGPNSGNDVFIPLSMVIGEEAGLGRGWSMLMEALAAGRGISLPALSTGGAKLASRAVGAYGVARQQFNLAIHRFEGVEEALSRVAGNTYLMDSARAITVQGIDQGQRPAVVTGIVKYQLTELMRRVINDAMDIQGGAGICLGPRNLLGRVYQSIPIGITVEGANILTRTFIIFNQSLLRCHPFIKEEIDAIRNQDPAHFDRALMGHLGFLSSNFSRSLLLGLGAGRLLRVPGNQATRSYLRQLSRMSAAFALAGDLALLVLGAELKRREKLTGRLSDVLGEIFLAMAVIKHFHDQGEPAEDLPLVDWGCQKCLYGAQEGLLALCSNFPQPILGQLLARTIFPLGRSFAPPDDQLGKEVAGVILSASAARDRLTSEVFLPQDPDEPLHRLDHFLKLEQQSQGAEERLHQAVRSNSFSARDRLGRIQEAGERQLLPPEEIELLLSKESCRQEIIAVDDFASLSAESDP
ncbi:acyl-CoA dehydrogenase [Desulfogranum mediterraneum]|uniref:acyl-CoA dehydrogenase n=1 Tax=Desulfogranum mediterraneum TaxID=160661 RepID=UPI00041ECA77|nr:acyl-CoA dehydrogenase [Desulfogranum mediterraneum]